MAIFAYFSSKSLKSGLLPTPPMQLLSASLSGDGAVQFTRKMGHPVYDPSTERSMERLREARRVALGDPRFLYKGGKCGHGWGSCEFRWKNRSLSLHWGFQFNGNDEGKSGGHPYTRVRIFVREGFGIATTGVGEEIIRKTLSFHMFIHRDNLEEEWDKVAKNTPFSLGAVGFNNDRHFVLSNRQMAFAYAKR